MTPSTVKRSKPPGVKCKRCGARAEVQLRQHNAAFCKPCFVSFLQRQVQRSIEKEKMLRLDEPVLVAVSGGKDSLALWDILVELGYTTSGLHLELGIGGYSHLSTEKTVAFAAQRGLPLIRRSLGDDGVAVPDAASLTRRPACSSCGTLKRYYMDKVALDHGYTVVATGHNLDDEAARLLGNVMHWQMDYLARQSPVLEPSHEKFARKIKPLYRCGELEMAAYAFYRGIDYILDECPNAAGATQLEYKDVLARLEAASPGSKLSFLQEFLHKARPKLRAATSAAPRSCTTCGMPSHGELCSRCRLVREVESKRARRRTARA